MASGMSALFNDELLDTDDGYAEEDLYDLTLTNLEIGDCWALGARHPVRQNTCVAHSPSLPRTPSSSPVLLVPLVEAYFSTTC